VDEEIMLSSYFKEFEFFLRFLKEKKHAKEIAISSIYFGGGTPSLAKPETIGALIRHLQKEINHTQEPIEITLEANPTVRTFFAFRKEPRKAN
jgi:oxygen-independent coproporphyrinogen-3 oxidase